MRRKTWFLKLVALSLALSLLAAPLTMAQQQEKPVMENVFFNVVWGSATGALLGASAAVIGSEDKRRPNNLRSSMFQGATAGGLIGLGVGIWLIFTGITFDPATSTIILADAETPPDGQIFARTPTRALPLELITAKDDPSQITGFKALVLDLKF